MTSRALLALATFFIASVASACSCITIPVRKRFLMHPIVFTGTVTDRERTTTNRLITDVATIDVSRWFAGGEGESIAIEADLSCGPTHAGGELLIFAHCDEGKIRENGCATVRLDAAHGERYLRQLRRWVWLWRIERWFRQLWHGDAKPACNAALTPAAGIRRSLKFEVRGSKFEFTHFELRTSNFELLAITPSALPPA